MTYLTQSHTQLEGSCQDCAQFCGSPKVQVLTQHCTQPSQLLGELLQVTQLLALLL